MRNLVLVLMAFALTFAWSNPATTDMMEAEYQYAACNAQFAKDYIDLREDCGRMHEAHVFDFSNRMGQIDDALDDAQEGAEQGNRLEYGAAVFRLNANMLALGLEVIGDAFQNKSQAFRNCVQGDVDALRNQLTECRANAFENGKAAAHQYLANDIAHGETTVAELKAMGADTMGMEDVLDLAEELDGDIDAAYDSNEVPEVAKLYKKHNRLVLQFRLEQMMAVMDYTEPIIEARDNSNKEELLEEIADLQGDTEDLIDECEYSTDVSNGYGAKNNQCWVEALSLMQRFNALRTLYWAGEMG